ncbi:MAG: MtrB/PioB family decaheme-associated outer membrane protein [Gammaproteobacteria bacterium]|jgi:MtrB/PioB family decaheme-associated outer membrane protein
MKRIIQQLLSLLTIAAGSVVFAADERQSVDRSEWRCQYCAFEQGTKTRVEAGLGYVSEDSFKFGEYTGLHEQGGFLIGNLTSRYRNSENALYWDITGTDLGLDSRMISLEGGKQGRYALWLSYDELPQYLSNSAHTPYTGSGGNRLTLPSDWVFGGTTGGMTALDADLSNVELQTKRTRWDIGAKYIPRPQWQTKINYRRETQEGKRLIAGSFYFNATEFAQPVDYTTDLIDIEAAYSTRFWQATLGYHGSTFKNEHDALTWQNPFSPIVVGATQGQLSLPPDNQFHQARASFAMRLSESSRFMADLAVGRLTQDEDFLSATANSSISGVSLPVNSLDGQVDTVNANVQWNSRLSDKLDLGATYRYSDRSNETPRNTYTWVTTDANIATPRTNLPYSYTRDTFKINTGYRLKEQVKLAAGYDYQQFERTYQEVEENEEQTLWASIIARSMENISVTMRLARSERDKDGYEIIPGVDSPENPLMRKYNMADRDRNSLGLRMDVFVSNRSSLGLTLDLAHDTFPDSDLGLTSSRQSIWGLDYSTQLTTTTTANLFISFEKMSTGVSGSQLYSTPDWFATTNDRFNTAGMGINKILLNEKLDIGVDYVITHSLGEISYEQSGSPSQLPDFFATLYSIKLYGNYRLSEKMIVKGTYWYEAYSSDDWAYDNVDEDTIPNFLSMGQETPSYNVNVMMISLRYAL